MSLAGRLLNVFAAPGEVFDEVKTAPPSAANWLVPALILMVVSWAASALVLSQEPIKHQMSEIADRGIQKQVDEHHMSEQDAERGRPAAEKWVMIATKIGAALAPILVGLGGPFFWGLIIWLAGAKALKGDFPYMKAVEVVGLGTMIHVLDAVVRSLLIVALGNLYAAPSPVLLIKDFDPQNTVHGLLSLLSVMTLWLLAVRAVGLARLSGTSFIKAAVWVYGIWVGYNAFFLGLGLLMKAALKKMTG
jgi:hypothetical protein